MTKFDSCVIVLPEIDSLWFYLALNFQNYSVDSDSGGGVVGIGVVGGGGVLGGGGGLGVRVVRGGGL